MVPESGGQISYMKEKLGTLTKKKKKHKTDFIISQLYLLRKRRRLKQLKGKLQNRAESPSGRAWEEGKEATVSAASNRRDALPPSAGTYSENYNEAVLHLGKGLKSAKILEIRGWKGVKYQECSGTIDGNGRPHRTDTVFFFFKYF